MTNKEIAAVFYRVAELLELKGKVTVFEIRAYQKAARTIEYLQQPLHDIYQQGGIKELKKIEGVGDTIADHIVELFSTGKLKKLAVLTKSIPKGELESMEIPGVGPKLAQKLFQITRANSRSALKQKLISALKDPNSALARELTRHSIKEKTIANIVEGVAILGRQTGRMSIAQVQPIAEQVLADFKKCQGILKADIVGSLRRQKETIGDVDIIAALKKNAAPAEVIKCFCQVPGASKVVNQGTTKGRIIHDQLGVQIDLEVLPLSEYGSLLQHFTGSKEHNVALRTWGVEHGFSISEHGIKKIQNSKFKTQSKGIIKCQNEEKVYQTLGMAWIPPELREDRGEIKAALDHKLPKLIKPQDIKGDLQMHTTFSDGHTSVDELAQAAIKLGYQYICITDHSAGLGITGGISPSNFDKAEKIIKRAREKNSQIKILFGVEVNIKADGNLDLSDELLKRFDLVLASVHSSFRQPQRQVTERYLKAIANPNVDILAHPTGRIVGRRESVIADWSRIFEAAAKQHVILEINAHPSRLDLPDYLVKSAKDKGVKFVISTDAHEPAHLGDMGYGVAVARRGWLTKTDVLNTISYDQLLKLIK